MELQTSRSGSDTTITVAGALDVEHAYRLYQAAVAEAEAGSSTITVDLAAVEFIDSVGLGMLVRIRDELRYDYESALTLRTPSTNVTRLLELTGLQGQFNATS